MGTASAGTDGQPINTFEVGTLKAAGKGESHFVGSSSGVYFVNTVRRAFAASEQSENGAGQRLPSTEDTIVGTEAAETSSTQLKTKGLHINVERLNLELVVGLGSQPDADVARELVMTYFRTWHPLFPFLHGQTFVEGLDELRKVTRDARAGRQVLRRDHMCNIVISQCVFNIAGLHKETPSLPLASRIQSDQVLFSFLGAMSSRHDLLSLQALIAMQLYLIATMSLRLASTVSGSFFKSSFHAGLHRCPARYEALPIFDQDMRKRVFWTAYAIDRYLSQSLGIPLVVQDSDCDVCLPEHEEMHQPRQQPGPAINQANDAISSSFEAQRPDEIGATESYTWNDGLASRQKLLEDPSGNTRQMRQTALAKLVDYERLVGRAIELWNKNVQVRQARRDDILVLGSDIDEWWNDLPRDLQELPSANNRRKSVSAQHATDASAAFLHAPFFNVLYQQLIILMNRPLLSLDPASPDFRAGLQKCIGAARGCIAALHQPGASPFWPGFLSATWMAGLIIAFACQTRHYSVTKASGEITICIKLLKSMSRHWATAMPCHNVLSALLADVNRSRPAQDKEIDQVTPAIRKRQGDQNQPRKSSRQLHLKSSASGSADFDTEIPPMLNQPATLPRDRSFEMTPMQESAEMVTNRDDIPSQPSIPYDINDTFHPYQLPATTQLFREVPMYSLGLGASDSWQQFSAPSPDPMVSGMGGDIFQDATWESLFESFSSNRGYQFDSMQTEMYPR